MYKNYRSKDSYISKDPIKRQNSLNNLKRGAKKPEIKKNSKKAKFSAGISSDIVSFAETYCFLKERDSKGKRKQVKLYDWQKEVFNDLFKKENDYSIALIGCPKKSGKTEMSAIVGLFFLFCKQDQEIFILGSKKDQAQFVLFDRCASMIKRNPELFKKCKIYEDRIINNTLDSSIRVLSSTESEAGLNGDLYLCDELWAYTTKERIKAFNEILAPLPNKRSLRFITSYAGYSDESEGTPLWELYKKGKSGDSGIYFLWRTNYNGMPYGDEKWLEEQRKLTTSESNFRRLYYNEWVESETAFLNDDIIEKNINPDLSRGMLTKEPCYLGIDIGVRNDHTALSLISKGFKENSLALYNHRVFKPEKNNPVNIDEVIEYIKDLKGLYFIKEVVFDPMQFEQGSQQLEKLGMRLYRFNQTTNDLILMTNRLQTLLLEGRFEIYRDTELFYYLKNCNIKQTPHGGRLVKGFSQARKIDLSIAIAMASSRAYEYFLSKRKKAVAAVNPIRFKTPSRLAF